jgi:hypothetical protein
MSSHRKDFTSFKYSIWNTRTEENLHGFKEKKLTESIEKDNNHSINEKKE